MRVRVFASVCVPACVPVWCAVGTTITISCIDVADRRTYGLDMNNKFKVALRKLYAKCEYKYELRRRGAAYGSYTYCHFPQSQLKLKKMVCKLMLILLRRLRPPAPDKLQFKPSWMHVSDA